MLLPSKKILSEYKVLVIKMVKDSVIVDITKTDYELLCDPEPLMVFLASFLYWSWCMVCQNLPKANKPSFVILFYFKTL